MSDIFFNIFLILEIADFVFHGRVQWGVRANGGKRVIYMNLLVDDIILIE